MTVEQNPYGRDYIMALTSIRRGVRPNSSKLGFLEENPTELEKVRNDLSKNLMDSELTMEIA